MGRFNNPVPQYFTSENKLLAGGKLYFYKSGTVSPLTTYKEDSLTTPNTNPVILPTDGRVPNIWYDGSAKVILTDANNNQIWERDPVGGEEATGEWALWDANITYEVPNIVQGSDDKFYISIINSNINNDPTTPSPAAWSEVRILGVWNTNKSYSISDVVQDSTGNLWKSLTNANSGNDPTTDVGTNWTPAVNGAKIAEVATLETRTTTAIDQSGGGTLTALRLNRLTDANTYTLPAANSLSAAQWIDITLPDEHSASQPTVQRAGSDTITDSAGTDTSILFDSGAITIRLTSDGTSDWSLDL